MLAAWVEWKQRCAIGLCAAETQSALRAFADARVCGLLRRYGRGASPPSDPWHLLESHLAVTRTREGKRYKDWLFARVAASEDAPVDVIQGGASLVIRDVVREFIRQECRPRDTLSLDRAVTADGTVCLLDILASGLDPVSEVSLREYRNLADRHAREISDGLSSRERLVLAARHLGVSLAHPDIETAAGCRKSALSETYRNLAMRTARLLEARYGDDGAESVLALTLMVLERVSEAIIREIEPERSFAFLFRIVESRHEVART